MPWHSTFGVPHKIICKIYRSALLVFGFQILCWIHSVHFSYKLLMPLVLTTNSIRFPPCFFCPRPSRLCSGWASAFLQLPGSLVGLWWSPPLLFENGELYLCFGLDLDCGPRERTWWANLWRWWGLCRGWKAEIVEGRKEGQEEKMDLESSWGCRRDCWQRSRALGAWGPAQLERKQGLIITSWWPPGLPRAYQGKFKPKLKARQGELILEGERRKVNWAGNRLVLGRSCAVGFRTPALCDI